MQPNFRRLLIGCAVLIFTLGCAHAAPSNATFSFIGEFSNVRHPPGHAYGYSVQLWKSENEIVGLLSSSNGIAADTPIGQLQNVHWDPANGSISFIAKLSISSLYLGNGKTKPTHDVFTFNGTLANETLEGTLTHRNMIESNREATVEQVLLMKSKESPNIQATTLEEWQQTANRILKFRGPKW